MNTVVDVQIYPDGRLNTRNAARYLGLAVSTLAMMRCRGTGPSYVKRGKVFYYKADLDGWLAEAQYTSTSESLSNIGATDYCTLGGD